jgi:tetratricopeptide (TPR) repeat protein
MVQLVSGRRVRNALGYSAALLVAAAPVAAEQARAPQAQGGVAISVGQNPDLSHIEFKGAVQVKRDGQKLIVTLGRAGQPDLTRLKVDPPKWLKSTDAAVVGGRMQLTLTLADDADARSGVADGATFINLFQRAEAPPSAAPAAPAGPQRPDPVPASGVVVAQATRAGPQAAITFPWKAPLGAAVFRRGEAVWVVFDSKARLDLAAAIRALPQYRMQAIDGPDWVALRIAVPSDVPYSAAGVGANWTLILGPGPQAKSLQIAMARASEDGPASLAANVAGATRVIWLDDPAVGDKLAVVTALQPSKGLILRRAYVDMAALPSAQGLAIEPSAENLQVSTDGDVVRITRPDGLQLSPPVRTRMATELELPQPAIMPGLVNFDQWSSAPRGFLDRYDALMGASANETNRQALGDKSAGLTARLGLSRFLVGSELSYEAIGMLNLLARSHPEVLQTAEFRGLRGAANVMARRYKEAQADFSAPMLVDDPASALWRGYADARLGQWAEARQEFQTGAKAMQLFNSPWRTRFARAEAEASLHLNDFVTATDKIKYALAQPQEPLEKLATCLVYARLLEAEGSADRALPIYDAVARAPLDKLAAPALLRATQIRLYGGKLSPDKAVATLNSLRFRWRGDSTELEVIRALGQLYLAQGRYREALDALRTARQRGSDLPEAVQIAEDLQTAFRNLFLNGQADGLEPVQALGLFYDFKELTPIGADGDEMVRKLAQRLVNVDLLDQAAQLLKYQADNRLDGVPRAEVDTDLAIIQLMARHPEGAIDALNASRSTLLPTAMQQQRRMVEARAWLQLGQLDHADEILGADGSLDGVALRAEVAWKRRSWPLAGKIFEQSLGDRWKTQDGQLAPEDESKLLRAAVAYSLAQDDASLARLRDHYQGFVDKGRWPEALKVALSGVNVEQITSANFAQAISDDSAFAGWAAKMRERFRDHLLGGPVAAPALRPMTTAEAQPAAQPAVAPTKAKRARTSKS